MHALFSIPGLMGIHENKVKYRSKLFQVLYLLAIELLLLVIDVLLISHQSWFSVLVPKQFLVAFKSSF